MPNVYATIIGEPQHDGAANRLSIAVNLQVTGGPAIPVVFHTSHQKHMLYSYINGDDEYRPAPAAINTIALVNDGLFTTSFEAYVKHMCSRIVAHGDWATFVPSAPVHAMPNESKGLLWGNDENRSGAEVHCFPSAGSKAVVFSRANFVHFINVMAFMFHAKGAERDRQLNNATAGWAAVETTFVNNAILKDFQLEAIRHKLQTVLVARDERIARERQLGQAARALQGRPPGDFVDSYRG